MKFLSLFTIPCLILDIATKQHHTIIELVVGEEISDDFGI